MFPPTVATRQSCLSPLASYPALIVRQQFESAELFGFETANAYDVLAEDGRVVFRARERPGGFWGQFGRQLGGHTIHPFEVDVFDQAGQAILTLSHPSSWFLQRVEVRTGTGRMLGTFEECFTLASKKLVVKGPDGNPRMAMASRFFSPWEHSFSRTPPRSPREIAHVRKQWDGVGRELFSDADTLRLDYLSRSLDLDERALLLAATLFIDLVWFEEKAHRRR